MSEKHENKENPRMMSPGSCCDCVAALEISLSQEQARGRKYREALERIERRTLRDAEGPELRKQNENNYADAKAALENEEAGGK